MTVTQGCDGEGLVPEIAISVRFELLGPVRARVNDVDLVVSAGRDRIVLAMLLLHAGKIVSMQQLIDAVWGERAPTNARNQVQGCVSRLRRRLTEAGVRGPLLLTDSAGYRINVNRENIDLYEFRRLCDQARAAVARGSGAGARDRYRQALALWRGAAFMGVDSALLRQSAAALDEERMQAWEECLQVELGLGAGGELVGELTELVRQHPYREAFHGFLMRALYLAGRQADALTAYRHAYRLLHDELGVEPSAELQRTHQRILNRDAELDPLATPAASAESAAPRELPAAVTGFTGRTGAMAMLDDLVADQPAGASGPVVISAIAGTAGVGKTALAVHWGHRVADRFPDGQLYLNLRGYASGPPMRPMEALAAMLRSLGIPPEQIPNNEAQAAALFRTALADRRVLVVLDNAATADQVRPLLPGSAGSLVLVTSRDRLSGLVARDGARRLTLDVLTPDEAHTLLTHLLGAERVEAEPDAVTDLAAACAYLPLALRIAASSINDHQPRTIAGYVDQLVHGDRLATLEAEGDQEASVLAILDLSYRTLTADTARLFRLLGIVPGPDLSPAAAATLTRTTIYDTTSQLRQLAAAHLIEEHEPGRYTFHDLLRLYAKRLANTADSVDERTTAVGHLFDWYLHTTDAAIKVLSPQQLRLPLPPSAPEVSSVEFDQLDEAIVWLDAERENLVAIIGYAAHHGPQALAWLLAGRLRSYFWMRRYNLDWRTVAEAGLEAARREGDLKGEAAARLCFANLHQTEGRNSEAAKDLTIALDLARRTGWIDGQAAMLSSLSVSWWFHGELQQAADMATEALSLNRQGGQLEAQATMLNNLGAIERELGRLAQSAKHHTEAADIFHELGHPSEGDALHNLGDVCLELGRLAEARRCLTTAVAIQRQLGDRSAEAISVAALAAVERDGGRLPEALDQAHASVELAVEIDHPRMEAVALNTLGSVQVLQGKAQQANESYERAHGLARMAENRFCEIEALIGLAKSAQSLDQDDLAWRHAERAHDLACAGGYRVFEGQALTLLSAILLGHGRWDDARDYARQALRNHRETGHRLGEARTLAMLWRIAREVGDAAAVAADGHAARACFADVGSPMPSDLAD